MRQNQWKKAGLTVLSAVFMGSLSLAAAGTGIPALAATKDVAVTEYDEAALEKFKDNTLEYWELPGLIERYNTDYQNQLQKYYYNPGGSTGLTKDQMSALAADLRAEADDACPARLCAAAGRYRKWKKERRLSTPRTSYREK